MTQQMSDAVRRSADTVTRSAGARRGKVFRERRRRGAYWGRVLLTEKQVDYLAVNGYLDGENTVDRPTRLRARWACTLAVEGERTSFIAALLR